MEECNKVNIALVNADIAVFSYITTQCHTNNTICRKSLFRLIPIRLCGPEK